MVRFRTRAVWEPNTDVAIDEDGRTVVVRVELAGAESESLRVFVDERHLFIAGRRSEHTRLRGGSLVQKEIAHGAFEKKLHLPVAVQYGEVTATYSDGMLTIALPIAGGEYVPASRTELRIIVKRILS